VSDHVVQLARHPTALFIRSAPGTVRLLASQPLSSELQLIPSRSADGKDAADGERQRPAQHPEQRVADRCAQLA
jgi:hypothetical protein